MTVRIAIFWSHVLHYHAARIDGLVRAAQRSGDEVVAFALRSGSSEFAVPGYEGLLGGRIDVLSHEPAEPGVSDSRFTAEQTLRKLDETEPDVVAIPGYDSRVARSALGWCRRNRRGAVLLSESQACDYARSWMKEMAKRRIVALFDAALVGGSPHRAYMQQLGMPADRIFEGYDVVDNAFWERRAEEVRAAGRAWRARLGLAERYCLAVCRFVPKKNVSGLLRSYEAYVRQVGSAAWPLVVVGDGPEMARIERQVRQAGLERRVVLPGYLPAEQIAPYYALATVFVLPSNRSEQWGLVVNEAMASGLPIFVSRICGCAADLVEEGVTGWTFDASEDAQLTVLMVRAAEMDLATLGRAARQRVRAYSPALFGENLLRAADVAVEHASHRMLAPYPPAGWWR